MVLHKSVLFILNTLIENGYKAYVIGGAVRNYLLGFEYDDFDIATNATPEQIQHLFAAFKSNNSNSAFGNVLLYVDNLEFQITTFRIEKDYLDFRHPDKVTFVDTLQEDIVRRDFTINAIAYNHLEGFVDYTNGINDIHRKRLKFIGNPSTRIAEDPLRILRALRFQSMYDLIYEPRTFDAITLYLKRIQRLSPPKVYTEFSSTLSGKYISKVLILFPNYLQNVFYDCPLLKEYFSNIQTLQGLSKMLLQNEYDFTFRMSMLFCYLNNYSEEIEQKLKVFLLPKKLIYQIKLLIETSIDIDKNVFTPTSVIIQKLRLLSLKHNVELIAAVLKLLILKYHASADRSRSKYFETIRSEFFKSLSSRPIIRLQDLRLQTIDLYSLGISEQTEKNEILKNILQKIETGVLNNHHTELLDYVKSVVTK